MDDECGYWRYYLLNMFNYGIPEEMMPKILLHGHIHEAKGLEAHRFGNRGVTVSYTATGCNYLEI